VIDRASGEDLLPASGPPFWINSVAINPDGRTVSTADVRNLILWDPGTGRERARFRKEAPGFRDYWYDLTRDGLTALAMTAPERVLTLCDPATGEERTRLSLAFVGEHPVVVGIGPAAKLLAVTKYEGDTRHLVDVAAGKPVRSFRDPGLKVRRAEFTPDGRTVFACCVDHTIQVWDVARGVKLRQFGPPPGDHGPVAIGARGPIYPVYAAALSPDGCWVAYGNPAGCLILFEAATGQEVHRLDKVADDVAVLAFSPDSHTLAWGGGKDSVIHLLEVATGKERHALRGHRGPVRALTFSADGKTLVSGSEDTTALVWDLTGRIGARGAWGKPLSPADLDAC
jgi:WD40 repeat protein